MEKKYFPIKTATACQFKWSWSSINVSTSKTASCCRAGISTLTPENFSNFHNTDKKISQRQLMLQGVWPDDCSWCKQHEDAGYSSYRTVSNQYTNQYPSELDNDLTAVVVTPSIVEISFTNTCNLSCIYCVPETSSKINQEYKKFGNFLNRGVKLEYIDLNSESEVLLQRFWSWMENNSTKLTRFNVIGGEPFYQLEFDHCLEYFETTEHPKLELSIVTNLMIDQDKLKSYVAKFKNLLACRKLKSINITCSIDCAGPAQSYMRHGIDLYLWEENFEFLMQQKWLTLNINQAINLLAIKTIPGLLTQLQEWNQCREIGHYFTTVQNPEYLIPTILGGEFFTKDFEEILELMPTNDEIQIEAKSFMLSIANDVSHSKRNSDKLLDLKIFLTENDRRRGTNWQETFPWLVPELENLNVV